MKVIREKNEGAAVLLVPLTVILAIAQELDLNFASLKFLFMISTKTVKV